MVTHIVECGNVKCWSTWSTSIAQSVSIVGEVFVVFLKCQPSHVRSDLSLQYVTSIAVKCTTLLEHKE